MSDEYLNFDDYSPSDMAKRVDRASVIKANQGFLSLLMLAILAGCFVALGAAFYTMAVFDSTLSLGTVKLIGGICFSLGLILVIVAGAELFTGNNLIIVGFASRKVTYKQVLKNWGISYFGNLLGSIVVVFLFYFTNIWKIKDFALGVKIIQIATDKVNLTFAEGLTRGILCNLLVCLAVWLCFSARTVVSKVAAIIFPITAFVALGFEHSIANMYFIPMGLVLKNNLKVLESLSKIDPIINLSHLDIIGFLGSLLSVTVGNIIGGVLVGIAYWAIMIYPKKMKEHIQEKIKK